jgi:hypothetical protein
MNLTTTTTRQIVAVEQHGDTCLSSLISFAECLNRAHRDFWAKPDEDLQAFLQALLEAGQLQELFDDHEAYASSTNAMLTRYNSAPICKTGALRQFTIENGAIVLTPIPETVSPEPFIEPEPVIEPEPQPEPTPEPEPLPEPEQA